MYILGISAFYHDSAACLLKDGQIIAAAQEERFTRKKHDAGFPSNAIEYCLREGGVGASKIDSVVFYEKPFVKFERLLETYFAFVPRGFKSFVSAMPLWIKEKLFQKSRLIKELSLTLGVSINWGERLLFSEHHLSHAASAFYPSPFDDAAVLTIDGVGEWTTTSWAVGSGKELKIIKEMHFPHSLGLLYSAFTYYTGFKVNSGEYKVMGLAPYGTPIYAELIKEKLIHIAVDGSFQIDMTYFDYATGLTMTNKKFHTLFGGPPRSAETEVTQREMDLAASIQKVTEDIVLLIAKNIAQETGQKNLCLAGGVALNCVANGRLVQEKIFDHVWIQPAAGDAGGALGAALSAWYLHFAQQRSSVSSRDGMLGSYLGPSFTDEEIETQLITSGATFHRYQVDECLEIVTDALAEEKAVGWMQGRMEFGPRSLGARSILADPRSPMMQKKLNLKVKYRESFRPFAPSVLREYVKEWFEYEGDSPYMLLVADVNESKRRIITKEEGDLFGIAKLNVCRSEVPAVTHVDYSARLQTVHPDTNPLYHALITKFHEKTGCPMLVNTSFNVRGEPIVCSPADAFKCFMGTDLDVLAIGSYVLFKEEQVGVPRSHYETQYALD
ncbi:MAG: carbamoyltransferase [Burkholderiales bacterium]|jgi:carbamoyltransferase|tara:strand:+ start:470 stop:2308 length:1839 start_codon:yes stop_codon:yes gene_type:complete